MKGIGLIGLIIGLAVIAGAVGGGWYLYNSIGETQTVETDTVNTEAMEAETQEDEGMSDTGSLMNLLSLNATLECTFGYNDTETNTSMNGTSFYAGDKMRVDYMNTVEGTSQNGSMIKNGDYMYIWGDGMPQGMKMKVNNEDLTESLEEWRGEDTENDTTFDPTQNVDYSCKPWVANTARFDPPSDVEFMDLSGTIQNVQESLDMVPSGDTNLCAVCANVPADQQATCKAQLNCE